MPYRSRFAGPFLFSLFLVATCSLYGEKKSAREVRSYLGGIPFLTEGSLPDGTCFRIAGRVTNPDFFTALTRTIEEPKVVFRRGLQIVTQFPESLSVVYVIRDQPCSYEMRPPSDRKYLTEERMEQLSVSLYWKHGMKLRPVEHNREIASDVAPILPYAKDLAELLPKRFAWTFEMEAQSRGVPLTDSLVFIFRLPNGWTAARVSARL